MDDFIGEYKAPEEGQPEYKCLEEEEIVQEQLNAVEEVNNIFEVCSHMCTYIHTYIHTCIHTYIHACIHTYNHTYTHTKTHTYIHALSNTHK